MRERQRRLALVFATAGIAALPLAWRGTSCGHDFDFHLESWMEVLRHWREGVLYPHWAASANYGAGEPRFVFYPPLSWMLGAILSLFMPWIRVPLVFTMVALGAMGISFFRMAREWMPENRAAIAACLYVANPYVLFVAYERAAYGELIAASWIPLLVLFGLREKPAVLGLSAVIAGLWLTNAPAAVMGCYALEVMVAVAAISERRWNLIARAPGGTALGLGLAGFYLIPAIYEQRWVEIQRAIGEGMRVQDSFLFGHTGEAFHDQVLRTASWIAVVLLASTFVAAILSFQTRRRGLWLPMLALAEVVACLLLPFSDVVWRHAPELRFLQFPWRWLLVLSLALAAFIGLALRDSASTRSAVLLRIGAVIIVAACVSGVAWFWFWQPCDEEDNVRAQLATFRDGGFQGTDEYTAAPADNDAIQQDLPRIRVLRTPDGDEANGAAVQNPEWQAGPYSHPDLEPSEIQIRRWDTEHITATLRSGAGFAVLRLMDYPAWRVTANGARLDARPRRDDGLMTIPVAAGVSQIDVRYGPTPDVWAGRILTLVAAFLWIGLAARAMSAARGGDSGYHETNAS